MTFFGIVWSLVIVFSFVKWNINGAVGLTLFSMILQCDKVLNVGVLVGPQLFTSFVFLFYSLLYTSKSSASPLFRTVSVFFSLVLAYIIVPKIINYQFDKPFLISLQLLIYLLCGIRMYMLRNLIGSYKAFKSVIFVIWFIAIFGPIQLLATHGIIPRSILIPIFFNDGDPYDYFLHPEYYKRLLGTFKEPSFCSTFLVGAMYYVLLMKHYLKKWKVLFSLLGIDLILTMSSTGYGSFFVVGVIYLFYKRKFKIQHLLLILSVCVVFYYLAKDTILDEVIFSKMESDSAKERGAWNDNALYMFNHNKIFGIGFQQSRASSFFYTLLAELGIIGTTLYLLYYMALLYPLLMKKLKANVLLISASFFLLGVIVSQMIACPDYQICTFWFGFYIYSLSIPYKQKNENINRFNSTLCS